MKLGFIGLGAMGKPMAKGLLTAGYELNVFDVAQKALVDFEKLGAKGCTTPAEVGANSNVIFMSLPNAAIVKETVSGTNGLLASIKSGTVIVDLSSVDPGCSRMMASLSRKQNVEYIDAPVSGGVGGAEAATLTIMVGGSASAIESVMPILQVLGKKVVHVGDVGSGDAIKIVNNMLLGANMAALAEALVLGKKLGLDGPVMAEIIGQGSGKSYVLDAKLENFILKGNFKPGFAVDLQYKDLGLALDAAVETGMPLPITSMAAQLFQMARAKGLGGEDMSTVIKVWEELMNVEVRA